MDLLSSSVFEWGTLGRPLMYLILEAALFFVITLCIDAYGRRGRAVAMPAPLQTLLVRWELQHAEHFMLLHNAESFYPWNRDAFKRFEHRDISLPGYLLSFLAPLQWCVQTSSAHQIDGSIDLEHCKCRARQSWARALQKLRGKLDEGGGYEELHQQHATVQMSAIAGVPQHVSQELTKEQDVYEAKVC